MVVNNIAAVIISAIVSQVIFQLNLHLTGITLRDTGAKMQDVHMWL